jgi:hypothetical protein
MLAWPWSSQLTKAEARKLIRENVRKLNSNLDAAVSQFQVRMCYVNAHGELHEIAKNIAENLHGEE